MPNVALAIHKLISASQKAIDLLGRYDFGSGLHPSLWRVPRHPEGKAGIFPSARILIVGGESQGGWDMDCPVVQGSVLMADDSGYNIDRLIALSWAIRSAIHRKDISPYITPAVGWCFADVPDIGNNDDGWNTSTLSFSANLTI